MNEGSAQRNLVQNPKESTQKPSQEPAQNDLSQGQSSAKNDITEVLLPAENKETTEKENCCCCCIMWFVCLVFVSDHLSFILFERNRVFMQIIIKVSCSIDCITYRRCRDEKRGHRLEAYFCREISIWTIIWLFGESIAWFSFLGRWFEEVANGEGGNLIGSVSINREGKSYVGMTSGNDR